MTAQPVIPGPKGHFALGNMDAFNKDTLNFLLQLRQYGDVARFRFGPFPLLVVNDPDVARDVLVTHADQYYKNSLTKEIMAPAIGNGLFVSDGDFWKHQRKLIQPAFHSKRISAYGQIMSHYAADLGETWRDGEARAIDHDMTALTMRIIAKTLFDSDIAHETPEVGRVIREVLALIEESFRALVPTPYWIPTPHNRKMREAMKRLSAVIDGFIVERRASGEDKGDFLSLLLTAQDEESQIMTDAQVRNEAMTLFGAGHETTAVTLMWAWYLLSQNPEVETRLHDELSHVLAGRLPTVEDLPGLPYLEMVVKETMRLYPAAYIISRDANETVNLNGYTVKKGQTLFINVFGIHRDERFYADPDRFDPERFSAENEKKLPKYAYIPFGGGPRVCIGNSFSLMEARLLLATLAQRYSLSVAPGFKVVPERQFTLRPKFGLQMVIKAR
ncbi:MAG TPA: cytochrome P450 [Aggregatilineales bacterium]|nr:cytochrome P450 [Aggregatilineales bacterium]